MLTIFEISAEIAPACVDGRNPGGVWGHERQYHAVRATAEAARDRLRGGGYWGCSVAPAYAIVERTRETFGLDAIGEQEWRHACRQAGVDPAGSPGVATS